MASTLFYTASTRDLDPKDASTRGMMRASAADGNSGTDGANNAGLTRLHLLPDAADAIYRAHEGVTRLL
jgi:hypothetical protein